MSKLKMGMLSLIAMSLSTRQSPALYDSTSYYNSESQIYTPPRSNKLKNKKRKSRKG